MQSFSKVIATKFMLIFKCSGGPRREFLQLLLREITDETHQIFVNDKEGEGLSLTNLENVQAKRFYFGAGLMCGKYKWLHL